MGAPEAGVKSSAIWDTAVAPGLRSCPVKWSSSKDSVGGAIARMPAMIFCGLCVAGRPQGGDVLSLSGLGWQI